MNWAIWIYAFFLFIGSVAMVTLGVLALYRRGSPVVVFFVLLCFASSIYAFGYAMEMTRLVPEAIKTWSRVEYMGIPFITSFHFLFVLHFVTSGRRIPKVLIVLPLLVSFIIMTIRQTNHIHWQYYTSLAFESHNGFMMMIFGKGLWYWIFAGYNVFGIVISAVLIAAYLIRSSKVSRQQGVLLLLGSILPIIPYIVHVSGFFPRGIDIIPAAITLSMIVFYFAVFRYNLFSLIPIGRDRLVETMTEAVIVLNKQHCVADANPSARREFCLEGIDPVGRDVSDVMPLLDSALVSGERTKANGKVWEITRIPLPSTRRSTEGVLIVAHDVTELERMAREDMLTGLLNRHSWDDAVLTEMLRLSRHGRYGSVIFVDLDHFKHVNDSHGHAAGDAVLKTVGKVLKDGVRRPDLVGRYGGEEFVIFLPESRPEEAVEVAERLRIDLMEEIVISSSIEVSVTGSFGIAGCLIKTDTSLEDLVNVADKALFKSKQSGRNRVTLYNVV